MPTVRERVAARRYFGEVELEVGIEKRVSSAQYEDELVKPILN
jgi:hypothetical protein